MDRLLGTLTDNFSTCQVREVLGTDNVQPPCCELGPDVGGSQRVLIVGKTGHTVYLFEAEGFPVADVLLYHGKDKLALTCTQAESSTLGARLQVFLSGKSAFMFCVLHDHRRQPSVAHLPMLPSSSLSELHCIYCRAQSSSMPKVPAIIDRVAICLQTMQQHGQPAP